MKKIDRLKEEINKDDFINYYSIHTRKDTADYYNINESDVKSLSREFGFRKSLEMIGKSVSKFYENNKLITIHMPGETSFIKVLESELLPYLGQGYILGYEQTDESRNRKILKSKKTKFERYGDENYNNFEKGKRTKLERYGDENYNNKDKIKETQYELYGCFAFNDKDKVEKTMLEKYGCTHNWSSSNPVLNGRKTMFEKSGSKDQHYKNIIEKGKQTKFERYGDEFYSNSEKAQETMLNKYGYTSYMFTDEFREKAVSKETRDKAIQTKRKNHTFNVSSPEYIVEGILKNYFGSDDVFHIYNDIRYAREDGYQFDCDFYIKSKDLFIELNLHPTHGLKPYIGTEDDLKILEKLNNNLTEWNKACIDVWSVHDVQKRNIAKKNNLNYLMIYPNMDYHNIIDIIESEEY